MAELEKLPSYRWHGGRASGSEVWKGEQQLWESRPWHMAHLDSKRGVAWRSRESPVFAEPLSTIKMTCVSIHRRTASVVRQARRSIRPCTEGSILGHVQG